MWLRRFLSINFIGTFIILAGSALIFFKAYQHQIDKVKIKGIYFSNPQQLQQEIQSSIKQLHFLSSFTKLKQALIRYPTILDVSLKREWPNIWHIELQEQRPVAKIGEYAVFASGSLVNEKFFRHNSEFSTLVQLDLINQNPEMIAKSLNLILKLKKMLYPLDLKLKKVYIKPDSGWGFVDADGVNVILGLHFLEERVRRYALIRNSNLVEKLRGVSSMDLRYTNGMAVSKNLLKGKLHGKARR